MTTQHTPVPVTQVSGGCGCSAAAQTPSAASGTTTETTPSADGTALSGTRPSSTASYRVTGMTCGHCVNAVSSELRGLPGVTAVDVALVAGGTSALTVTSAAPLSPTQVSAALDEAGDYRLAD